MAKKEIEFQNSAVVGGTVHKIFQQTKKFVKFCLKITMETPKGNEYSAYVSVKSFDKDFCSKVELGDNVMIGGQINTEVYNDKMYTYVAAEKSKILKKGE